MQRKLVKQGNSALTVTLPSGWVKENGLAAGDLVSIQEKGSALDIFATTASVKSFAKLQLSKDKQIAQRQLGFAYKRGVNDVEVFFEDPKMFKVLNNKINDFIGFEIVAHTKKSAKIKNIASANEEDLDTVMNRAFLVTLQLADEGLVAIQKKKYDDLKELLYLEKVNNKLTDFCKRILNRKGLEEKSKTNNTYRILVQLEQIADLYRDLFILLIENARIKISSVSLTQLQEANTYFREFYKVFLSKKANELDAFLQSNKNNNTIQIKDPLNTAMQVYCKQIKDTCFDFGVAYYELLL